MNSNGLKLASIITKILDSKALSLVQKADITSAKGGDYNPSDMKVALASVLRLDHLGDTTELIKLYKRLPAQVVQSDALAEFLDVSPTALLAQANLSDPASLVGTPLASRDYRINNLYKIINKKHEKVTFKLNTAQQFLDAIDHPRIVVLKSRQRGISTYAVLDALDEAMTQPDKIKGLQADNLLSANALMEKVKLAYESLPPSAVPSIVYSNNSEISFSNGSKLRIATSFRGATLSSLHVSELGKIALSREKSRELTTGTFPAIPINRESRITLESTSEGGSNLFHTIFTDAQDNYKPGDYSTFYPLFIGWVGIIGADGRLVPDTEDPDCWMEVPKVDDTVIPPPLEEFLLKAQSDLNYEFSPEQLEWACAAYRIIGNDIAEFAKEYPTTIANCWASSTEGLILAESFQTARVNPLLEWNNKYPRYFAADLGVGDTCVVLGFQYYDGRLKIIEEHFNTGKDIAYYTNIVIRGKASLWFLPHDANNRNVATAKKVVTHVRLAGFNDYRVMKRATDQWTDISRVRGFMPFIEFGNVPSLITAIKGYRKVWSNQTGTYLSKALHDDNSNYADSLRYSVVGTLDFLK